MTLHIPEATAPSTALPCNSAHGFPHDQSPATSPHLLAGWHATQIGIKAGVKKGIWAFAELWIYGSGCPRLTLERHYLRAHNELELRVVQGGGVASRRSAERAAKKHHSGADEASHGAVKVWLAGKAGRFVPIPPPLM